jgi:uncharacterized protein (TIGR03435 family)
LLPVGVVAVCFGAGSSQTTAFDAASVKVVDRLSPGGSETTGGPGTSSPGRIRFPRALLADLVASAYDVALDEIVGPDWIRDSRGQNRYEVVATMPPNTSRQQLKSMLQNLLAERFRLVVHREHRTFPGYALVVARGGPKLKTARAQLPGQSSEISVNRDGSVAPPHGQPVLSPSRGRLWVSAPKTPLAKFANDLSFYIPQAMGTHNPYMRGQIRPRVIDNTGLAGLYDIELECYCAGCLDPATVMRQMGFNEPGASDRSEASDPPGGGLPNIFTALEKQLGLRLEKVNGVPVEVIVIDRVNKIPTAN